MIISNPETGEIIAKIMVIEAFPSQVRLGIDAADTIRVDRQEVYEQRERDRKAKAKP